MNKIRLCYFLLSLDGKTIEFQVPKPASVLEKSVLCRSFPTFARILQGGEVKSSVSVADIEVPYKAPFVCLK